MAESFPASHVRAAGASSLPILTANMTSPTAQPVAAGPAERAARRP